MSLEVIKQLNVDFHDAKYISINAKQYDKFSRFILITCYNNGVIFPINNVNNYVFIRYRKPDDLGVFNSCEITDEGKILVELSEQMLAIVGKSYADLVIVHNESISDINIDKDTGELIIGDNSSILSTMHFCVNVIETSFDNTEIESSYEYNALNELMIKATADYTYIMNACKISEENAKTSETNAATSEINAKTSETNAKESETNARTSEENAKTSETNAATSETNAKTSEENASVSELNAKESETIAITKATESSQFASNSAQSAIESADAAQVSANKAIEASDYATLSKSYAVGSTNTRYNEDADNAQYYYSQAKAVSDSIDGSFILRGTIEFSQLESVPKDTGYMYHISDEFVTDDTFKCGAGVSFPAGTNVYYTADGYWDYFITKTLVVTDDDNGNVTIRYSVDSIVENDERLDTLNRTIAELQERIKSLEECTVLEIVE